MPYQLKTKKVTFGVGFIDILFALVSDQSFAAAISYMEHRAKINDRGLICKRF